MADLQRYRKPPITEAVIDFGFSPVSENDLQRISQRFKSRYSKIEGVLKLDVNINNGVASAKASPNGFKMTAANGCDVIMFDRQHFGTIRLAPYEGWESLITDCKNNFASLEKIINRTTVNRIGVRYVNRIDVPLAMAESRPIYDFLITSFQLPPNLGGPLSEYTCAATFTLPKSDLKCRFQSAIVPSILIDHRSITLDLDVFLDANIPIKRDDFWEKLEDIRDKKNQLFESSITPLARGLFDERARDV